MGDMRLVVFLPNKYFSLLQKNCILRLPQPSKFDIDHDLRNLHQHYHHMSLTLMYIHFSALQVKVLYHRTEVVKRRWQSLT